MFPQGLILDISASLTVTSATIRDTAKTDLRSVLVSEPDGLHMRNFLLAIWGETPFTITPPQLLNYTL